MGSIFRMMIVLVLLVSVVLGATGYWLYVRSDELLRLGALRQLEAVAPDLKFGLERANYDLSGRACLFGLSIQLPGDVEPSLYIPETVATLDQQQMTDFENVLVTRLRIVKPSLRMVRQTNGHLNWQGITLNRGPSAGPLPDIEIEHGTAVLELHRLERATRKLKLNDLNVTAIPTADRRVNLTASTRIDPAGPLQVAANLSLDGGKWNADAKWRSFPVDDEFLQLLADISPEIEGKIRQAKQSLADIASQQIASMPISARPANAVSNLSGRGHSSEPGFASEPVNSSPVRSGGVGNAVSLPLGSSSSPMRIASQLQVPTNTGGEATGASIPFGLKCVLDLTAQIGQAAPGGELQFRGLGELKNGQINNELLPFPLYDLRGSVYLDQNQAIVRDLHAGNGTSTIDVNAKFAPSRVPQISVNVTGIELNEALVARLPEAGRKLLNSLSLTGVCDAKAISRSNNGRLQWDAELTLKEGTAAHEKFPLRIRDISGTVSFRENVADIKATGRASGAKGSVVGTVKNPGPEQEASFDIRADDFQLDNDVLMACPPVVQKTLNELKLKGRGDVWLRANRAAGMGQRFQLDLAVKGRDCSCSYSGFPYSVQKLSGLVTWNGETVSFKNLLGEHDGATIKGAGQYQRLPAPGRLDLVIKAENAAFDRALEAALPPSMRLVWNEFQPQGRFHCETQIGWVPGQPVEVSLPSIQVIDSDIELVSFPWEMHEVTAEASYSAPRLTVRSFAARHDDTQIRGRATANIIPNQPWNVRFDELHIDDLVPNASFRKSLPGPLRRMCETLDPSGKFSISTAKLGPIDLIGPRRAGDNIAAAWNVQLVLAGCGLTAGLRVEDIHGRMNLKGDFDGTETNLTGRIDFDSISVFRQASGLAHQVTAVKGPIRLSKGIFVAGSEEQAQSDPNSAPIATPPDERITGEAIDGRLTLDARADLREEIIYRANVSLERGLLERYAQRYLRGQTDLQGVMNGGLRVWGTGTDLADLEGRGRLEIAPAALYELPVFVRMFRAPEFVGFFRDLRSDSPDKKAFDRADIRFSIGSNRFQFERIDLIGNALSLRGRGFVRFDGAMQLDFYSMLARSQVRFPVIHEIAKGLSRGWVGVKVTGTVGNPQTVIVPVPEFDDAMKQFLGNFDPRPSIPNARSR